MLSVVWYLANVGKWDDQGLNDRGRQVALFISTFVNKVDKKGRVSVPAPFRAALAGQSFAGIVAYPSFVLSAIEACGIDRMEELSQGIHIHPALSELVQFTLVSLEES